MELNIIHNADCLSGLKNIPDNSIDCCITSPPYYAMRDYGVDGQIGLEETPDEYIARLTEVFEEVRRVLKPAGTLWINIGDTYNRGWNKKEYDVNSPLQQSHPHIKNVFRHKVEGLKHKDLIGIPWMLAFSLRGKGWYLRQDIIWNKPNPMPESVTDRCCRAHEYLFLLTKKQRYYFDFQSIQVKSKKQKKDNVIGGRKHESIREDGPMFRSNTKRSYSYGDTARKRSVWTVPVKPEKSAHIAVFPYKLIVDCIKAGCPEDGIVLDPFMGSGTTAVVARKLNRNYIGFELNPKYLNIAKAKIHNELGIFK